MLSVGGIAECKCLGGYYGNPSAGYACSADTGKSQVVCPFTLTFQKINLDSDLSNTKSDKFFTVRAQLITLLWLVFLQLQPLKPPIGIDILYFTYAYYFILYFFAAPRRVLAFRKPKVLFHCFLSRQGSVVANAAITYPTTSFATVAAVASAIPSTSVQSAFHDVLNTTTNGSCIVNALTSLTTAGCDVKATMASTSALLLIETA